MLSWLKIQYKVEKRGFACLLLYCTRYLIGATELEIGERGNVLRIYKKSDVIILLIQTTAGPIVCGGIRLTIPATISVCGVMV